MNYKIIHLRKVRKLVDVIPPSYFSIEIFFVGLFDQVFILHESFLSLQLFPEVSNLRKMEIILKLFLVKIVVSIKVNLCCQCRSNNKEEDESDLHDAEKQNCSLLKAFSNTSLYSLHIKTIALIHLCRDV